VSASFAKTDRGRRVPLFHYREADGTSFDLSRYGVSEELVSLVIAVAPPDWQANCHGWVFTEGRAVIRGHMVDAILSDNGYGRIDKPQTGDLIVYRDAEGVPSHTGIVRAAGPKGVLIESKWGFLGRYLHEPEQQGYSQSFAYYHSPRAGHVLRIEEPKLAAGYWSEYTLVLSSLVTGV
jgi:hypothetical protein